MMKTVMVVDDEEMTRAIIKKILKRSGYEVIEVSNGSDALDMIKEISPDVVIMDMQMPDMDGFELAEKFRRSLYLPTNVPILMLTGFFVDQNMNRAGNCKIDAFMSKPFDMKELISTVAGLAAGESWKASNLSCN